MRNAIARYFQRRWPGILARGRKLRGEDGAALVEVALLLPCLVFLLVPLVADLRAMNLLEDAGGRVCGGENLFCHALCPIPVDLPPLEALARTALADPMVGPAADRAEYVCRQMRRCGAEAMIVSRIPGASHCAAEGTILAEVVRERLGVPAVEIEVPPVLDAMEPTLRTRLEALVETVRARRR